MGNKKAHKNRKHTQSMGQSTSPERNVAMAVQRDRSGRRTAQIEIRDTVGVYLRLNLKDAPIEGDEITISVGRWKTQLVASHVTELKNGLIGVHAFVQKGQGDGVKLAKHRLKKARLSWKCS